MIRQGFYRRPDGLAGIDKVPGETVDYTLDWSSELQAGQTIASATWTVPAGVTGTSEGVTGALTSKRLSGGTAGSEYRVTCQVTKNNGEVVPRVFVVTVVAELS